MLRLTNKVLMFEINFVVFTFIQISYILNHSHKNSQIFDWKDVEVATVKSEPTHKWESPSRPATRWTESLYRPYFATSWEDRNVTAQLGKSTFLKCKIKQITDETVSWVRQKDLHIISAGDFVYTSDQRFKPKHVDNSDEWYLNIKYVQKEDSGTYECQISSEPKKSLAFYLNVIEAKSEILGSPSIFVQSKETINLTCIVNQTASPPMFIYWYRDNKVLHFFDSALEQKDPRLKVKTGIGPISISILQIIKAKTNDSGNYSCRPVPQYSDPANITVYVLNGENPAAMQHSNQNNPLLSHAIAITITLITFIEHYWINSINRFS